ncbi:hypothetical protein V8C26DRAFT_15994 [Trichoderma gracile]
MALLPCFLLLSFTPKLLASSTCMYIPNAALMLPYLCWARSYCDAACHQRSGTNAAVEMLRWPNRRTLDINTAPYPALRVSRGHVSPSSSPITVHISSSSFCLPATTCCPKRAGLFSFFGRQKKKGYRVIRVPLCHETFIKRANPSHHLTLIGDAADLLPRSAASTGAGR